MEYRTKISFKPRDIFVKCVNKMSSENPLEKEIISLITDGLKSYVGQPDVSRETFVERISEVLKNTKLIPNFKIEVVQDSEEEKLIRKVLEEELDPTLIRMNITYDLPVSVNRITLQLPDEPALHRKDEKP